NNMAPPAKKAKVPPHASSRKEESERDRRSAQRCERKEEEAPTDAREAGITDLPYDVFVHIAPFLSGRDRSHLGQTCRMLHTFEMDYGRKEYYRVNMEWHERSQMIDARYGPFRNCCHYRIEGGNGSGSPPIDTSDHYTRLFKKAAIKTLNIKCFNADENALGVIAALLKTATFERLDVTCHGKNEKAMSFLPALLKGRNLEECSIIFRLKIDSKQNLAWIRHQLQQLPKMTEFKMDWRTSVRDSFDKYVIDDACGAIRRTQNWESGTSPREDL
ncbi:hypothetical protein PFISCL1PPCAC_21223, partial [Pristionchus fissidentatus]